ncbi:MAG: hypothetical protein ACYS0G_03695 [Planctomycetota bacterium]|jgi:hypothetical protein
MRLRAPILLALLAVLLILSVVLAARRQANAHTQLRSTQASLARVAEDARRVVELRQEQRYVADRKRPEQDVIARVNATLAEAGIPLDRFSGQRPASDSALPSTGPGGGPLYRRQTVQISLRELTVPDLGAFLGAWSASQDLWTPTQIELTHVRRETDPARYNAMIAISATYLAE